MKRYPVIPTVLVAAAVAVMIGLGIWQLHRAQWKDRMIAELVAASTMPALDLDPLLDGEAGGEPMPPIAFRKAIATCHVRNVLPDLRGGRSIAGEGGYAHFVRCRPDAEEGLASRLIVNAGWAPLPERDRRVTLRGVVAGQLGSLADDQPIILTSATAARGLVPSAPPSVEDIPNNHLAYAIQWFLFAGVATIIYLLALRHRRAPKLPPEP